MSAASKLRIPNDFGQRSAAIIARISAPDDHWQSGKAVCLDRKRLEELLPQKFIRWESLEEKRARSA